MIIFAIWWNFWGVLQMVILQDFGVGFLHAFVDSAISNTLLAALCLLIINNMSYYLPGKERYLYVLLISVALGGLWMLLTKGALRLTFKNDPEYLALFNRTSSIRYSFGFLMLSCMAMLSLFWYTRQDQQENELRKADAERLVKEAELNKLRQQLQPHFLFNSLNSISALTGSQPEKARHMIQQLADFLRGTLKKEEQQWTTFEEELQYLQLYLDIEKVRFGYRLQTAVTHNDDVLQMKLPPLILQPLVENAIKFGLYDTIGEVCILIAATANKGMLEVTVQNPFDEATAVSGKGTGFGLTSIKRRLFLLFGRQDLLEIKKEPGQFITKISIPQTT